MENDVASRIHIALGAGILTVSAVGLCLAAAGMAYPFGAQALAAVPGIMIGWRSGKPG
jgi:hypothetical protein